MTSSRRSRFVGNFPNQLTQNMLSLRNDRVLARVLVAISHLKHVTEHFCIQPYAEHAGTSFCLPTRSTMFLVTQDGD